VKTLKLASKLKEQWKRDPWLFVKYLVGTIILGLLGKTILVGAKESTDLSTLIIQFVPVPFMMPTTFLVHRYLWNRQDASLRSEVGNCWSMSYGAQFVAGHAAFTLFAVMLGLQYLLVSLVIGTVSMLVTLVVNGNIFDETKHETSTA
jgi:hypothetical protein